MEGTRLAGSEPLCRESALPWSATALGSPLIKGTPERGADESAHPDDGVVAVNDASALSAPVLGAAAMKMREVTSHHCAAHDLRLIDDRPLRPSAHGH